MIRVIWVGFNAILATCGIGVFVIGAALLRIGSGHFYDGASKLWARWILRSSGVPLTVIGAEKVPTDRPEIFVSNHQSWFDVLALGGWVPKRARFVAKKELENIPVFGTAWKSAGHISIDRGDRKSAIDSLDRAGRLLREDNSSVVIFAEGTRSATGKLLPFKKGAFMLALHSGVDIVPVAITGTREVMPKGKWRIRKHPITVRFGDPIHTADFGEDRRDELIGCVRDAIAAMLRER